MGDVGSQPLYDVASPFPSFFTRTPHTPSHAWGEGDWHNSYQRLASRPRSEMEEKKSLKQEIFNCRKRSLLPHSTSPSRSVSISQTWRWYEHPATVKMFFNNLWKEGHWRRRTFQLTELVKGVLCIHRWKYMVGKSLWNVVINFTIPSRLYWYIPTQPP